MKTRNRSTSFLLTLVLAVTSLTALSVSVAAPALANDCSAIGQATGQCNGGTSGEDGGGGYVGPITCSGNGFRYSGGVPYCFNQSVNCWVGAWNGTAYDCYTDIYAKEGFKNVKWEVDKFIDARTAWEVLQALNFSETKPQIATTPLTGLTAYIGIPVWMWLTNPASYANRDQGTSAAGINFALQHRFQRVVWTMGNGNSITCYNPGTPYTSTGSIRMSPDCGYTYPRRSNTAPGGTFPVSATTYWNVYWQASTGENDGGQPIQLTSTSDVRLLAVKELQARNTNGN